METEALEAALKAVYRLYFETLIQRLPQIEVRAGITPEMVAEASKVLTTLHAIILEVLGWIAEAKAEEELSCSLAYGGW